MSYFNYQSKRIFYKEAGQGKPLMMLHGDTASSAMFDLLLPLYQDHFRVIVIDFLGNPPGNHPHFPHRRPSSHSYQCRSICTAYHKLHKQLSPFNANFPFTNIAGDTQRAEASLGGSGTGAGDLANFREGMLCLSWGRLRSRG